MEDEKRLRAVIRDIPVEIESSVVLEDLKRQDLPVHAVHRMHKGDQQRTPYGIILVFLDLSARGRKIFDIRSVCGLSNFRVEPPRNDNLLRQCNRCQVYGHSALH